MGFFDWFRRRPIASMPDEPEEEDDFDPAEPELTDELDLHTFQPKDVADLVDEYLRAAQDRGFPSVRIIHGKGKGTLRRIVHSVCETHSAVASFRLGDQKSGSWGATLVELRPRDGDAAPRDLSDP